MGSSSYTHWMAPMAGNLKHSFGQEMVFGRKVHCCALMDLGLPLFHLGHRRLDLVGQILPVHL